MNYSQHRLPPILLTLFLFYLSSLNGEYFCYLTPPLEWEIADPSHFTKSVHIAFVKKTNSGFCPSINLAIEKTDLSMKEYLKVIQHIHESDRLNHWRHLGKLPTASGIGELTEIDTSNQWGPIRILQLIFMNQGYAYIVTAAALKKDFPQYYSDFKKTFTALKVTSDLISSILEPSKIEQIQQQQKKLICAWEKMLCSSDAPHLLFQNPQFQNSYWLPFQNMIIKEYTQMGAHWQMLFIKTTQETLLRSIQ